MSVISAHAIRVHYPRAEQPAVDAVDLQLRAGERTVLLGPSGAGKSSLLRVLARLQDASSGSVSSDDPALIGLCQRQWRRRVSMIFQDHALIPRKSALWHVMLGCLGDRSFLGSCWFWPRQDINAALQALQQVGLNDLAHRPVRQLSGGQRQRVGIARALLQQPQVLLADEPIASLDPHTGREILDLLSSMLEHAPDRGLLVSLHQVEAARAWAQRIIGMRQGRICFDGPPDALDDTTLQTIYGDGAISPDHTLAASPPAVLPTRHHLLPLR